MYKPFSKKEAVALCHSLQSLIGRSCKVSDKTLTIDNITPIPAADVHLRKLADLYFRACNGLNSFTAIAEYITANVSEEYDVAAFAKGKGSAMGFAATVIPVSIIGVTEDGPQYGFSFLDDK